MARLTLIAAALTAALLLAPAAGGAYEYPSPYPTPSPEQPPAYPTPPPAYPAPVTQPPPEGGTARVVKRTHSEALRRRILTTKAGRTLYSLSSEKGGNFVCADACLSIWRPLTVAPGVTPLGPVRLGTVKRPEGLVQVTFRGLPLYTYRSDRKRGDTNGEGIRDVGVWRAAGGKRRQAR